MGRHGLTDMPHLASRVFGTPLAISRGKLDAILTVLAPRLGIVAPLAVVPQFDNEDDDETDMETAGGIAVIPIIGTLVHRKGAMEAMSGMTSYADIYAKLDAALSDSNVKAILLEIDSPGGEVSGCFELAEKISAASKVKPVHALADSMACSAAYALACAADQITTTRTGDVGSIGVVALHLDQSAQDQGEGLKYTYVYAGDRKVDGNPHAPLSPRAHAAIQGDIDKVYQIFVKHVADARSLTQTAVRGTEAGTFMGEAAVAAGLADQVGTLEDALASLGAELNRRKDKMSLSKIATKLALAPEATEDQIIAKLDESAKAHADISARAEAAEKKALTAQELAKGFEEKLVSEQRARITEKVDAARAAGAEVGVLMVGEDRSKIIEALASTDGSKKELGAILLERYEESAKKAKADRTAGVKVNPSDSDPVDLEHEARSEASLRQRGFDVIVKDAKGRVLLEKCSTPEGRRNRGDKA